VYKINNNPWLEEHPEKINWFYLSANPNAIHLLEANPEKIDWFNLSAIRLLEANLDKINYLKLCRNSGIFDTICDYYILK